MFLEFMDEPGMAGRCLGSSLCRLFISRVPKIAAPMVEPIWRKNWLDEVATPSCRSGTALWMARVKRLWLGPRPRPTMNMRQYRSTRCESERMPVSVHMPRIRIRAPPIIQGLYLPVRATMLPAVMLDSIRPSISGSMLVPLAVGDTPSTICM